MENIYIKTLNYGVENIKLGTTYNNLIKYLKNEHNLELNGEHERYFRLWFFEKFYQKDIDGIFRLVSTTRIEISDNEISKHLNSTVYLKGDAYLEYIDYIELNEARKSSKRAHITAIAAIIISCILAFSSIIVSLKQNSLVKNEYALNQYRNYLNSNSVYKLCEACYHLSEVNDYSSIDKIAANLNDPRISHNLKFKGMSVYQCKATALRKLLNIEYDTVLTYKPDSLIINRILNAIEKE